MTPLGRLPTTLLGFCICALLEGLLILQAGVLLPSLRQEETVVVECVGFPTEGRRQSISQVRLFTFSEQRTGLEVNFLDVDGTILRTRHVDLEPGAATSLEVPTRQVGIALQVVASAPVGVEVTLVYDESAGPPERRTVPCWRLKRPQPTFRE